jgi:hypothetical protein
VYNIGYMLKKLFGAKNKTHGPTKCLSYVLFSDAKKVR